MTNFPLIYCNGDSYSASNTYPEMKNNTYADFVAKKLNGFVINNAISGSCNRRIIRSSVSNLLEQRKLNPTQHIIALIGLSFELRSEIWNDELETPTAPEESNFCSTQFSPLVDWRERLLSGLSLKTFNNNNLNDKFFKKYSEARAFFFSPYAERINLLLDLIMLRALLESLDIKFLIFQSPKAEKLESDYLLDQFKQQIANDQRIFDLETFAFCDWSFDNNFVPFDQLDTPRIGHYKPDAHQAFAERVLLPQLYQTNQIK